MQSKPLLTRFFAVISLIFSGLFILPTAFAAGGGGFLHSKGMVSNMAGESDSQSSLFLRR